MSEKSRFVSERPVRRIQVVMVLCVKKSGPFPNSGTRGLQRGHIYAAVQVGKYIFTDLCLKTGVSRAGHGGRASNTNISGVLYDLW